MFTSDELESYNLNFKEEIIGKFGKSYIVESKFNKQNFILKEITHPSQIEFLSHGGDQVLMNLSHPLIPKTERIIWEGSKRAFILRAFHEGKDLKQIISNRKFHNSFSTIEFVNYFIQHLEALEYLHCQNIIHQDIKPSNIIINKTNCFLIDIEQARTRSYISINKTPFALLYSPPEMVLNFQSLIDERADIYSVGISLYETITRKRAFENLDPEFTMNLQLTYPLTNNHNIDKSLFAIIKRATMKGQFPKPPSLLTKREIENILSSGISQRYTTAAEMRLALMNWIDETSQKKSWKFWK